MAVEIAQDGLSFVEQEAIVLQHRHPAERMERDVRLNS
jgi:hypothetical protein